MVGYWDPRVAAYGGESSLEIVTETLMEGELNQRNLWARRGGEEERVNNRYGENPGMRGALFIFWIIPQCQLR